MTFHAVRQLCRFLCEISKLVEFWLFSLGAAGDAFYQKLHGWAALEWSPLAR